MSHLEFGIFESRLQRLCESNLNRAKKYANKSPVYFTVFRAFLYIVPCTGSCRRIRNSLSCRTICETICLSLFSNMGSQAYAVRSGDARMRHYAAAAAARRQRAGFSTPPLDVTIIILCTSVNIFMVIIFGKFSLSLAAI